MMGGGDWVSWLILVGGMVLALLGVIKIVASSARLLLWMVLLLVGLAAVGHGVRQNPAVLEQVGLSAEWSRSIRGFLGVER
ncbi:MAG: hypothetical protein G8237_04725 [Magnetococcales bacterium]|nr:hypothetical protein [Magnetococcales bacterium]